MKKKGLLIFLMSTIFSFSQSEFQIEANFGYAFQKEMILNNEKLDNTHAFGIRLGVNYLKMINENLYIETGVYGKYNRGNKEIETLKFTSHNLRIQIPLYLGYKINEKWNISFGASIENNKDKLDFKSEENLRYDLINKIVYSYTKRIQFTLYSNNMFNSLPGAYTIISPKNGIYIGVIYNLIKK